MERQEGGSETLQPSVSTAHNQACSDGCESEETTDVAWLQAREGRINDQFPGQDGTGRTSGVIRDLDCPAEKVQSGTGHDKGVKETERAIDPRKDDWVQGRENHLSEQGDLRSIRGSRKSSGNGQCSKPGSGNSDSETGTDYDPSLDSDSHLPDSEQKCNTVHFDHGQSRNVPRPQSGPIDGDFQEVQSDGVCHDANGNKSELSSGQRNPEHIRGNLHGHLHALQAGDALRLLYGSGQQHGKNCGLRYIGGPHESHLQCKAHGWFESTFEHRFQRRRGAKGEADPGRNSSRMKRSNPVMGVEEKELEWKIPNDSKAKGLTLGTCAWMKEIERVLVEEGLDPHSGYLRFPGIGVKMAGINCDDVEGLPGAEAELRGDEDEEKVEGKGELEDDDEAELKGRRELEDEVDKISRRENWAKMGLIPGSPSWMQTVKKEVNQSMRGTIRIKTPGVDLPWLADYPMECIDEHQRWLSRLLLESDGDVDSKRFETSLKVEAEKWPCAVNVLFMKRLTIRSLLKEEPRDPVHPWKLESIADKILSSMNEKECNAYKSKLASGMNLQSRSEAIQAFLDTASREERGRILIYLSRGLVEPVILHLPQNKKEFDVMCGALVEKTNVVSVSESELVIRVQWTDGVKSWIREFLKVDVGPTDYLGKARGLVEFMFSRIRTVRDTGRVIGWVSPVLLVRRQLSGIKDIVVDTVHRSKDPHKVVVTKGVVKLV